MVLGGAVMLAWTTHTPGHADLAAVSGSGTTAAAALAPLVPCWARVAWLAASPPGRRPGCACARPRWPAVATGALALAGLYIGAMIAGSRLAERQVRELAAGARLGRRAGGGDAGARRTAAADGHRGGRRSIPVRARQLVHGPGAGTRADGVRTGRGGSRRRGRPRRAVRAGRAPLAAVSELRGDAAADGGSRVIIRDARFAIGSRPGSASSPSSTSTAPSTEARTSAHELKTSGVMTRSRGAGVPPCAGHDSVSGSLLLPDRRPRAGGFALVVVHDADELAVLELAPIVTGSPLVYGIPVAGRRPSNCRSRGAPCPRRRSCRRPPPRRSAAVPSRRA